MVAESGGELLKLGNFIFRIGTAAFNTLARSAEYRWATLPSVGRRPNEQWIGEGSHTITLDGTIFPLYNPKVSVIGGITSNLIGVVGLYTLDELRDMASTGDPYMLVDGLGNVYGKWVILSVQETQSHLMKNGAAKRKSFTISLRKYGTNDDISSRSIYNKQTNSIQDSRRRLTNSFSDIGGSN